MSMNLGAMGGAAGNSLEDILKQKFLEQIQKGHLAIAKQQADDNTALRMEAQRSAAEDRASRQQSALSQEGTRIGGNLTPGADVTGQARVIQALTAAGLAPSHKDATLGSANLSGIVSPAAPSTDGGAVPGVRLARSANPGQSAKDIYGGTDKQRDQQAQEAALKALADNPNTPDHIRQFLQVRSAAPGGAVPAELFKDPKADTQHTVAPGGSLVGSDGKVLYHEPDRSHPPALITIQTVDANGNAVTKVVPKTAGSEFAKPANATTATRVSSAETVNAVGNDIISKLSDPKFAGVVGPVMGRAGTLGDLIGNPPPEFSELAGQIESYALANMGVHGMRSAQGAEAIKHLLEQHHTPESLIATIRGLNDFSTRFVQNNKPKAPGAPGSGAGPAKSGFSVVEVK